MAGLAKGTLRHIALRVEHDCPLARLSAAAPTVEFRAWSAHVHEVVEVRCKPAQWPAVAKLCREHLDPEEVLPFPEGGLVIWSPPVEPDHSVSRILEADGLLWLQPMQARAGWERYEAIAFRPGGGKGALAQLSQRWPTQVLSRRDSGPEDLLGSLFQSLRPILEAPTERQAEALVAAWHEDYYEAPRGSTTADVAAKLGLSRSAFEERLRGAENRVLSAVAAHLERRPPESG